MLLQIISPSEKPSRNLLNVLYWESEKPSISFFLFTCNSESCLPGGCKWIGLSNDSFSWHLMTSTRANAQLSRVVVCNACCDNLSLICFWRRFINSKRYLHFSFSLFCSSEYLLSFKMYSVSLSVMTCTCNLPTLKAEECCLKMESISN